MLTFFFLCLTALCAFQAIVAAPVEHRAGYAVYSSHFVPPGWEKLDSPRPDHKIDLRIGLKQASFPELERHLFEVSDPNHPRYGQHLSSSDIRSLTAPSEDALRAVQGWLEEYSITAEHVQYSPSKDWASMTLPVSKVEQLLDTQYDLYHNHDGVEILRTTHYSLPKYLHNHIDTVQPTNYFSSPRILRSGLRTSRLSSHITTASKFATENMFDQESSDVDVVCNSQTGVTSRCVRALYKTIGYTPKSLEKNLAATTNYLNQTPSWTDFKLYMAAARPETDPDYGYTTQIIANASNDQANPGVEANLDIQVLGGIVYPTKLTTYSTGGSPPFLADTLTPTNTNEPYLTWLASMSQQERLPSIITTSYGDSEQTVPRDYAVRVCDEFAQLGARGTTLLFSSGDDGVGADGTCISNDGHQRRKFLPIFPASCPYVTSVGGTRDFTPEVVGYDTMHDYVAGGGFSEYFSRPAYQTTAVLKYLCHIGTKYQTLYNRRGRAYPDLAAQSYNFLIAYNASPSTLVYGTSVASPVAAGVLTLINDALLAAGKAPLGFLNPLLYATNGAGFNDVTTGSATGCETSGFPATEGWDAASGFGSPDFQALRDALGV